MDGRAHSFGNAPHTSMGFWTGEWLGDKLRVRTTHIKQRWHRRKLALADKPYKQRLTTVAARMM